jgi:CTLH/CRA C-terminal to LisH motif domain
MVEHNAAMLEELERTLTLLIGEKSPHSHLLNLSHRKALATKVNTAILKSEHGESSTPRLAQLLKIFLWAQDQLDHKKVFTLQCCC